jgi:hypothetical protein
MPYMRSPQNKQTGTIATTLIQTIMVRIRRRKATPEIPNFTQTSWTFNRMKTSGVKLGRAIFQLHTIRLCPNNVFLQLSSSSSIARSFFKTSTKICLHTAATSVGLLALLPSVHSQDSVSYNFDTHGTYNPKGCPAQSYMPNKNMKPPQMQINKVWRTDMCC